jgi:hypothetical protein
MVSKMLLKSVAQNPLKTGLNLTKKHGFSLTRSMKLVLKILELLRKQLGVFIEDQISATECALFRFWSPVLVAELIVTMLLMSMILMVI